MVALRQAGKLARHDGGAGGIPPVLVQFWDSAEIPADIEAVMRSWPSVNPGYRMQRFNEASAASYLLAHFPPAVLAAFRRVREPAQKADMFRLARLAREGGVYADADDRCLAPLASILPVGATFVVYQEDYGTLGNNFIAAAPGHPVLGRALAQGVNAINRGDADVVWLSTGPALLTRAFTGFYGAEIPPGVLVLDRRELFQAVAVHCSAGYKKTEKHWSNSTFAARRNRAAVKPAQT
jgi:mannosyltransferase OCH1-like enzyme